MKQFLFPFRTFLRDRSGTRPYAMLVRCPKTRQGSDRYGNKENLLFIFSVSVPISTCSYRQKQLFFGIIVSPPAFQNGLVIHDTAPVKKIADAVFCIEVQVLCSKTVLIFVNEFNNPAPDFCNIQISQVMDCFTGKAGQFRSDFLHFLRHGSRLVRYSRWPYRREYMYRYEENWPDR